MADVAGRDEDEGTERLKNALEAYDVRSQLGEWGLDPSAPLSDHTNTSVGKRVISARIEELRKRAKVDKKAIAEAWGYGDNLKPTNARLDIETPMSGREFVQLCSLLGCVGPDITGSSTTLEKTTHDLARLDPDNLAHVHAIVEALLYEQDAERELAYHAAVEDERISVELADPRP